MKMSKFTASNGVGIERGCEYWRVIPKDALNYNISDKSMDALREFFLHERDQELGRWRWPKNPNYAVYPQETTGHTGSDYQECSVVDEMTGYRQEFGSDLPVCNGGYFREAARAYFAAHPAPKPWHDAKPGEVWVFDWACDQDVAKLEPSGQWRKFDGEAITSGDLSYVEDARCIWPEDSNDS